MKKLNFVLAFALSLFILQSCQKDTNDPVDPYEGRDAPELPAVESFIMPFDTFEDGLTHQEESGPRTIGNFAYSAANVVIWNTVLTVQLAIPVATFFESFNHDPVYQGQGVWLWAYQVSDNGETYKAKLYGELLVTEEVKWDMYVSKVGAFTDFHYYTGITAWDDSYANWKLNFGPEAPDAFMAIDFIRDSGNASKSIRYTYIIPGAPEDSSYIEYKERSDASLDYNRAYDVYKAEIDNLLEIKWNSANKSGRVKDLEHFQDEEWHCWGADLQDMQC